LIPEFVQKDLEALGLVLDPEALERLDAYLELLLTANRGMNLTAIRDPDAAWRRLIVDSLTPLPLLELSPGARAIDIGTGAGLPGIPLAIVCPELHFSLVDSTRKKIGFLESVCATLGLENVEFLPERVETIGQSRDHRETYDIAISRAVGSMPMVLEYSLPLVKVGGVVLAMKGPKVVEELEASGDAMMILGAGDVQIVPAYPESFENELVLVRITKEEPTPREYPRPPGTPKKEPL
jgi:16S rRNA (guanine527-N7)-methyltransferase